MSMAERGDHPETTFLARMCLAQQDEPVRVGDQAYNAAMDDLQAENTALGKAAQINILRSLTRPGR